MSDYISRADAIEAVRKEYEDAINIGDNGDAIAYDVGRILSALPSADAEQVTSKLKNPCDSLLTEDSEDSKEQKSKLEPSDLISRADAIKAVAEHFSFDDGCSNIYKDIDYYKGIAEHILKNVPSALPSAELPLAELKQEFGLADAVHGWRIGKPTEQGEYIVTVDSMRHGMVELMYYGKPIMPNIEVSGACWYRDDDEWGDVVYDDKDIIAWMPLPTPYKGGDDE